MRYSNLVIKYRDIFFLKELEKALDGCKSVLDVGCGENSSIRYIKRPGYLFGIDIFNQSLKRSKELKIHDKYKNADIRNLAKLFKPKSFDAVIAIDVVEHFKKNEASKLIEDMERIASKRVVLLTPNGFYPQGKIGGNPNQVHLSGWTVNDLSSFGFNVKGLRGLKLLRGEYASIKYKPWFFWGALSFLTEPLLMKIPYLSYHLFAVKEMKKFKFSPFQKILYFMKFTWYKLVIIRDTKDGWLDIYKAEINWVIQGFSDVTIFSNGSFKRNFFHTIFGKFHVNPTLTGTYIVSPAFERPDINKLLSLIGKEVKKGKKILFIDVGAYFGTYSVAVGNAFKKSKKLDIIAFEPEANNFADNNMTMLKKNIKENNLKNIKVFKIGLGKTDAKKANKFGLVLKKLDSVISPTVAKKYDSIFMKIDIEGGETDALMGAEKFLANAKSVTLLVEDFIDPSVITYLEKKFTFLAKVSPQNSFWEK